MKSLFISLLFLFASQININIIKIDGLAAKYYQNQTIEFSITNSSANTQYYHVSVECYDKNGWSELINDITDPDARKSLINTIRPKQKVKKIISIKNLFYLRNYLGFKKYRFKIVYGESVNNIIQNRFSKSFELVGKAQ